MALQQHGDPYRLLFGYDIKGTVMQNQKCRSETMLLESLSKTYFNKV